MAQIMLPNDNEINLFSRTWPVIWRRGNKPMLLSCDFERQAAFIAEGAIVSERTKAMKGSIV
jgi:hypothetical protein